MSSVPDSNKLEIEAIYRAVLGEALCDALSLVVYLHGSPHHAGFCLRLVFWFGDDQLLIEFDWQNSIKGIVNSFDDLDWNFECEFSDNRDSIVSVDIIGLGEGLVDTALGFENDGGLLDGGDG